MRRVRVEDADDAGTLGPLLTLDRSMSNAPSNAPGPAGSDEQPAASAAALSHPGPAASTRTLLVGIVLTVVVLVGAGVVAVSGGSGATNGGTDGAGADIGAGAAGGGVLADRVAPTDQAPLPETTLGGFGDGESIVTSDYRGRPLVLNFWGSWCAPCVDEMPYLQEFADAADGRVVVLGVNYQDQADPAAGLVDELGITYDLAVDEDGALFRGVGGFGMPTTLFVDEDGVIRFRQTGPIDAAQLADLVADHLGVVVEGGA